MTEWPKLRKLAIWFAAVLCTFTIGLSRVYLGVHYPTDVLAGYAAAIMWTTLIRAAHHVWQGQEGRAVIAVGQGGEGGIAGGRRITFAGNPAIFERKRKLALRRVALLLLGAFFFEAFLVVSCAKETATLPRASERPSIKVISFFIVKISWCFRTFGASLEIIIANQM